MAVLTITSDFGSKDYYQGALKGALVSHLPDLKVIDISHSVPAYDIVYAAYIVKNSMINFPRGTIHFIPVNNLPEVEKNYLFAELNGQFFLCPDNGLISMLLEDEVQKVYRIPGALIELPYYSHMVHVIESVVDKKKRAALRPCNDFRQAINLRPVTDPNEIRGAIIHIDHYGNLVSNIRLENFEEVASNRNFKIYLKPRLTIEDIHDDISSLAPGEVFAQFNAAGLLCFGLCLSSMASLYDFEVNTDFQIKFE